MTSRMHIEKEGGSHFGERMEPNSASEKKVTKRNSVVTIIRMNTLLLYFIQHLYIILWTGRLPAFE